MALAIALIVLVCLLVFYRFYFLRDPARCVPIGDNIVSPADGRVTLITEYDRNEVNIEKKFFGKVDAITKDVDTKVYIVSIFMNILNVHVNRSPIDGVIKSTEHSNGRFLNAKRIDATFENENIQTLIVDGEFKIKVIQIAGLIARRIASFIQQDEKVIKGQKIGIIKLGSQVTLILPSTVRLRVKKNQKVFAGKTIIADR
jgi:phosphatidylserine decarboxylase